MGGTSSTSLDSSIYPGRNLYATEATGTLAAEAARLTANRSVIAGDLCRDPGSWARGWGNVAVLDVLIGDCLDELLRSPSVIEEVA